MALDERARQKLFTKLEQVLGQEPTDTLMGYLPPVGWADVVTKDDLESFGNSLRADWRKELNDFLRTVIFANVMAVLTVAALAFGAARIG